MKVAIIGARGIGRVHAGVLHREGHVISHVVGRSLQSATDASLAIAAVIGFAPQPACDLRAVLDAAPDAVVIATPPETHEALIMAVAQRGIPMLCEKPLFWSEGLTYEGALAGLDTIARSAGDRLMLASPNAFLADAIVPRIPRLNDIGSIRFAFHTQGPYRREQIGVDLLTHAFTVVQRLIGNHRPRLLAKAVSDETFACRCDVAGVDVGFDFRESAGLEKAFEIQVNDRTFQRIQRGAGTTYRVAMRDVSSGEEIVVDDPFMSSARAFVGLVHDGAPAFRAAFADSARVFESMALVLTKTA